MDGLRRSSGELVGMMGGSAVPPPLPPPQNGILNTLRASKGFENKRADGYSGSHWKDTIPGGPAPSW